MSFYKLVDSKKDWAQLILNYFGFTFLVKLIPFLMHPILTRIISPEGYGFISLYTSSVSFVTPLVSLGALSGYNKIYFERTIEGRNSYLSSIISITIVIGVILVLILFLLKDLVAEHFPLPFKWVLLIPIAALFDFFIQLKLSDFVLRRESKKYGVFNVSLKLFEVASTLLFVFVIALAWEGKTLGLLTSFVFLGSISISLFRQAGVRFHFNKADLHQLFSFGIPLLPHLFSGLIINLSDRFFIQGMVGMTELGIYSLAYQLGMIVQVVSGIIGKVWNPMIMESLNSENPNGKRLVKYSYLLFGFYLVFSFFLSTGFYFSIDVLFGEGFQGAKDYIFLISLSFAFLGMYNVVYLLYHFKERTFYLSKLSILTALINLVLNYVLINSIGALGAAVSTLVCYMLLFLLIWLNSSKVYPLPWLSFTQNIIRR